ncbi:Tad domain-containing protein [Rhodobacter sp. CZR27]|uniref:Tad domain-containing protein n=1 Tax=Rhodobacter sp. CZR27 TaxID=2033869 RepID=UPI000BBE2154|nr:Tad domain-containing protein [Rhodobacter sp. CZR27]
MTRRPLREDEEGAILVFWAVALAVMLGMVALSFDMGRMAATQSELQAFADQVALAAAGELDGRADSIDRARDAAAELISDRQTFGAGAQDLDADDFTLTFLASLPADDRAAMADVTTDPHEAIHVRATVAPRAVPFTFAAAFFALTGRQETGNRVAASAVAGYTQYACDITPMMFCLPHPDFRADEHIGEMVLLRSGGQNAAWGPGDFGFIDPDDFADDSGTCSKENGVKRDQCLIGAVGALTQCVSQRGVDMQPGQREGIAAPVFNVRFDIYEKSMQHAANDPKYPAAPNVIKGYVSRTKGKSCDNSPGSPDSMALPRDTCFATRACSRYGDGNWAAGRTAYVAKNYGGTDPHPGARTRYEYYLAEIAAAAGGNILTGRSETGRPICSKYPSTDPERRVITVAGIDCTTTPVRGSMEDVPVVEFFRMFLTEPVGDDGTSPPTVDMWAEIVGSAEARSSGSGGYFHDVVQLYR